MNLKAYGILVLLLLTGAAAHAQEWANIATQGALISGRVCQTDGADIVCDTDSPEVNAGGLNATQLCDEAGDNCKDLSAGWATSLAPDSLDWSDMKDAMTLDAATDISTSGNNLSVNTDDLIVEGASGKVGIGTLPTNARLDVAGAVKVADETDTCSSADDEGKIRYTAGEFSFCQDYTAGWETFADVAPAAGGGGGPLVVKHDNGTILGYVLSAAVTSTNAAIYYLDAETETARIYYPEGNSSAERSVSINQTYYTGANCTGDAYTQQTANRLAWHSCSGTGGCSLSDLGGVDMSATPSTVAMQSYRYGVMGATCSVYNNSISNAVRTIPYSEFRQSFDPCMPESTGALTMIGGSSVRYVQTCSLASE